MSDKEGGEIMSSEKCELILTDFKRLSAIVRSTRPVSLQSRYRYDKAMIGFCGFLSERYSVETFANIETKHIEAYSKDMKNRGCMVSTRKTFVSAIRFFNISSATMIALLLSIE